MMEPSSPPPWHTWVRGSQQGDGLSQRRLFDHFLPMVMGIALRYTGTHPDACDVAQETFIKAFRQLPQLRDVEGFPAWLKKITVHAAIDFLRTRRRFQPIETVEHQLPDDSDRTFHSRQEAIMQCLAALPEGYRMVLNLYDIEGYSHREIAQRLGISEGTSRSQLAKARRMMQQLLKKRGIER